MFKMIVQMESNKAIEQQHFDSQKDLAKHLMYFDYTKAVRFEIIKEKEGK